MITFLVYFVVVLILFSVAYYAISALVEDARIKKILYVVLYLIGAIAIVYMLLGMVGGGGVHVPSLR
jgi:uncharacterized membrane protein required for colicin V production